MNEYLLGQFEKVWEEKDTVCRIQIGLDMHFAIDQIDANVQANRLRPIRLQCNAETDPA